MTDPNSPRPATARTRKTDRGPGWLRWVHRNYEKYGAELQLALGIVLLVVSTVVLVLAFEVRGQGDDIQDQRAEVIRTACREQNARNRNTIAELRRLSDAAPANGRSQAERDMSVAATIRLINALVPVRNCEARARRFVRK